MIHSRSGGFDSGMISSWFMVMRGHSCKTVWTRRGQMKYLFSAYAIVMIVNPQGIGGRLIGYSLGLSRRPF